MSGRGGGKKALITGAAQGLGAASAWGLAREGARVLLTDVNEAGARQVAAAIDAELGAGVAHSMRHDVSSEDDWIAAIARARETMGGLSVLVNNAGIAILGSVEDLSLAEWRRGMAVNADSVFLGSKHALPLMRENQPGSIVNISSISGLRAASRTVPYGAVKAALMQYTLSEAAGLARQGIRVNCVAPGSIEFPGGSWERHKSANPSLYGAILAAVKLSHLRQ